ncbi:MAG: hypothetical protein ACI85U_002782 [Candidatus Promineifilaceae bacterium]|jgi:hypothetical protein
MQIPYPSNLTVYPNSAPDPPSFSYTFNRLTVPQIKFVSLRYSQSDTKTIGQFIKNLAYHSLRSEKKWRATSTFFVLLDGTGNGQLITNSFEQSSSSLTICSFFDLGNCLIAYSNFEAWLRSPTLC